MDDKLQIISYVFATLSSACLLGGIVILSREGRIPCVQTRGDIINVGPNIK